MIARLVLLVIATGCSAPPERPSVVTNHKPAVRPTAAGCPVLGFRGTVWLHEVFPGCSAMPFLYPFQVCVGDCPRPTRARWIETRPSGRSSPLLPPTETRSETYEYDAKGNWVATRRGEAVDDCLFVDGRIASCGDGYEQWQRRADGRLTALLTGSSHETWMEVTYDGRGDARELVFPGFESTHRFTYDADHRMLEHRETHGGSEETVLTFTYEAGRLVSRDTGLGRNVYSYDDRGRLVRVEEIAGPDAPDHKDVVTLAYDAQDRVVKIVEDPRYYGGPVTTLYDYDNASTILNTAHTR